MKNVFSLHHLLFFSLLVILIPIIFTIILCSITYCVYRYNKKRSQNARRYAPTSNAFFIKSMSILFFLFGFSVTDRSGASIATVVYNPQHNPYMLEELPPSYDSLEEIKKHFHQTTTNNQSVANPTASTPPPPSYRELLDNVNNK